ncbi:MAG: S9 family peptidase [Myxococcales bacterium]|nr:S9 family peptidase [Myxococcales bacterium]MCB9749312.1 S9 family peptidase [Myxococcales bacterium]
MKSPHPFSVLDLLAMDRLSQARVSPDGTLIAYTLRQTDMAANKSRASVWIVPAAGGEPRKLTTHPKGGADPRWSPDGEHVYFISSRSGSSQVWRAPAGGEGAAEQITDFPVDVAGLVLSPDGAQLAVSAELFPDCQNLACTAEKLQQRKDSGVTGELYERVFVRHWDTWKDGRRGHLLVARATPAGAPSREASVVTRGLDADVPSKPFGGSEEYTFTPDGRELVFTARVSGETEPWSTNFDLYAVSVDGGATPRNLTEANAAWDTHPLFSPDGKTLVYLAMERPGYEADRFRVIARPWPEGPTRVVSDQYDNSIRDMTFRPDGSALIATAQDHGQTLLLEVKLDGAVSPLVGDGTVSAPGVAGDRLVFLRNDLGHPDELWSASSLGGDERQLTHVNDERVAAARTGEYQQFDFTGWGGERVYGWAVKPVDFKEGERYPLAFLIHGGPQGSFGNRFHYRWNPQTYAGAGYAVVMIDFHGSTGYGQSFTDSIRGDWGGKPLEDLKLGLKAALEQHPWIDGARACALGASYGGFMINWIAGVWPDRFRCLVNHDGIFDQRMMYYATEELWFPEWEHGGPYFQNPEGYERHNPAHHVDKWKTPMLVVHGSLDYRVPVEQGLATFNALQRRGVESQLLHFPDENHWVLKPKNSRQWHDVVGRWLDRHLAAE